MSARRPLPARVHRRGFTLLEVMVALTLTAMVVTLAGTALDAARRARASVTRDQETAEADARVRALLTDMLRHAPAANAVDEALMRLAPGAPFVFLSRGVVQPFGTGRTWRVTVAAGADGVTLDAVAIGRGAAQPALHASLPQYRALRATVLERADAPDSWRVDWPVERSRPAAVRLEFGGEVTGNATAPLVVSLAPLDMPPRSGSGGVP